MFNCVRELTIGRTNQERTKTMLIKIKFLGPTNFKGSRYKATVKDGDNFQFSATVPSTYKTDNGDVLTAAQAVAEKIRLDMNSRVLKAYPITAYDVEIVGSYDGDHYATMTPVYSVQSIEVHEENDIDMNSFGDKIR